MKLVYSEIVSLFFLLPPSVRSLAVCIFNFVLSLYMLTKGLCIICNKTKAEI